MLIEFKVTRLEDKLIGFTTNSYSMEDHPPDLPVHTTKRIKVSVYNLPPDVAPNFHKSLIREMGK